MIRKGTWIVLAVFVVLLAGAFYLSKNPLPQSGATLTPIPTQPSALLSGWKESDITYIAIKGSTENLSLTYRVNGGWDIAPDNTHPVDAGKVENLRSQLATMTVESPLDASIGLESIGLANPVDILTLKNTQGQQTVIKVGQATPTGSGYYVQRDSQPPVIVNKTTMDAILDMMKKDQLLAVTPTPAVTEAPAVQTTPAATSTKAP